ncbi:hypothetical protein L1987_83194 [Smallanthus sonchifolius]|uniref:Uncharacterized protein n=1 Tax=Smallanthus sonchifolius TaxID=185202 RepID=A0ACB8YD56_9ASTR|nr:hypothetical protein L1987_83194 [Smallanthus sonchifolius]
MVQTRCSDGNSGSSGQIAAQLDVIAAKLDAVESQLRGDIAELKAVIAEEIPDNSASDDEDRSKHVLGVQLNIEDSDQMKIGDAVQLRIGVGGPFKMGDLKRTNLEVWAGPLAHNKFLISAHDQSFALVDTFQHIIKDLEIDLHTCFVLDSRGVQKLSPVSIEWLIAWGNTSLPDLWTSRFSGPEVLIRTRSIIFPLLIPAQPN